MSLIFIRVVSKLKQINVIPTRFLGKYRKYKHVVPLDDTLIGRLLFYIDKPAQGFLINIPQVVEKRQPAEQFQKLKLLSDKAKWEQLQLIDAEYTQAIEQMDTEMILNVLNEYMHSSCHTIVEFEFYNSAITILNLRMKNLSKRELVKFMFYVGLQKKNKKSQVLLKKSLALFTEQDLKELSIMDICIICNATFKTSTKINRADFLKLIKEIIKNNLFLLNDTGIFTTLIKTLRHNRGQDDEILATISCTIFFNFCYKNYPFNVMCHILALFVDFNYYDTSTLHLFKEKYLSYLKDPSDNETIRVKDIKRFLWAFSTIGFKVEKNLFSELIVPKIKEMFEKNEYRNDYDSLIESILYIWILGYQPKELLYCCLTENSVKEIRSNPSKAKYRLNLLLTCIQLENLKLYKELNIKPLSFNHFDLKSQISDRPYLSYIYDVLNHIKTNTSINKFEYSCEIPHLKIVGLTGFKKNIYKSVFIEVFDDFVCVKNKDEFPNGLMQLKVRLLENMDQALIMITQSEIQNMTAAELEEYLLSELNMVI